MNFIEKLTSCFNHPLPGLDAHLEMAPLYRRDEIINVTHYDHATKSSVLILFYCKKGQEHLVFIKRPEYDGIHSGQIALPGGRWEAHDKDYYETATREAHEETGIDVSKVSLLGKLTNLYIPPSNYLVYPFVAMYDGKPIFKPDPKEVAGILEIPFRFFLLPTSIKTVKLTLKSGLIIQTPCFDFRGTIVWGATAMMINELIILWKTTGQIR
jgi:8-oxo-dGTP pyrophosphatase MutT (NUDIX family)